MESETPSPDKELTTLKMYQMIWLPVIAATKPRVHVIPNVNESCNNKI